VRYDFDPEQRAREKDAARQRDLADVAAGRRCAEQVNRENSIAHGLIQELVWVPRSERRRR
jgi:hypothetical protein